MVVFLLLLLDLFSYVYVYIIQEYPMIAFMQNWLWHTVRVYWYYSKVINLLIQHMAPFFCKVQTFQCVLSDWQISPHSHWCRMELGCIHPLHDGFNPHWSCASCVVQWFQWLFKDVFRKLLSGCLNPVVYVGLKRLDLQKQQKIEKNTQILKNNQHSTTFIHTPTN